MACQQYHANTAVVGPLSKYLGGGSGNSGPIAPPPPPGGVCLCIDLAKRFCAEAADCHSCVWGHKEQLATSGCKVWASEHSQIVNGACSGNPELKTDDTAAAAEDDGSCASELDCQVPGAWGSCRFVAAF